MDYPKLSKPSIPQPVIDRFKQDRLEWVNSDCKNKFCIEGGVSVDDGTNWTYYRCPMCTRSKVNAPEYEGPVEYLTDEDMAARLKDRKDVYFDKDYRYKRGIEVIQLLKSMTMTGPQRIGSREPALQTQDIGGPF